jgi:hypothetical protein
MTDVAFVQWIREGCDGRGGTRHPRSPLALSKQILFAGSFRVELTTRASHWTPESRVRTSSTAGQGAPFADLFGLVGMAAENARAICRASYNRHESEDVFRSWCQTVRRLEAYTLTRTPQSLPSATPRTLDTSRRNLPAEGKGCRWAIGHRA